MHGLRICPDVDTVTYTLAGAGNPETGWGLAGESWQAMDMLRRYDPDRTWFGLGDRDLGTHLFRTGRLGEGAGLAEATAEITRAWGIGIRILPMTDDPVATRIGLTTGVEIAFQGLLRAPTPCGARRVGPSRRHRAGPTCRRRPGGSGDLGTDRHRRPTRSCRSARSSP